MQAEAQAEHRWLARLVGEWTYETECATEPGEPPARATGSERVRPLGGLWILAEGEGEMPGGGQATTLLTIGYDPQRRRYVGTWVGSMMTHLWVYDGSLDPEGRRLTLEAEGPDFGEAGKTASYRDVLEFLADDHRTLTSHRRGEDGTWTAFMTAHYRRKA